MRMPRLKVAPVVAAAMVLLGAGIWIFLIGSKGRPEDRKITVLALSATSRWLASGTAAGRISIWDQGRGQVVREIRETHGPLNDLRFSPDERQLAIANGDLTVVSMEESGKAEVVRDDEANYGTARFTGDGRAILVIAGWQGSIEVIEAATHRTILTACCSTIYGDVAFGPDGASIFNAGHNPSIWDANSGRLLARLTNERELATLGPIAFDGPRNMVYMGSQDGRVYGWDLNTRQLRAQSPPQSGYVNTISVLGTSGWMAYAVPAARTTSNIVFDPSSNRVLLGTEDGVVESWDLFRGELRQSLASP